MPRSEPTDPPRVLIVDPERRVRHEVCDALRQDLPYVVAEAATGREAVCMARAFDPQVIVLDPELPDRDVVDVCHTLRATSDAALLLLAGRDMSPERLADLARPGEDYVTKPFARNELAARVRSLMRRADGDTNARRVVGDLLIDLAAREVRVGTDVVELTRIEFDLLATLAARAHEVVSRSEVMTAIWGDDRYRNDHTLSVHVANLRAKLGNEGARQVTTVRGVGYRLI